MVQDAEEPLLSTPLGPARASCLNLNPCVQASDALLGSACLASKAPTPTRQLWVLTRETGFVAVVPAWDAGRRVCGGRHLPAAAAPDQRRRVAGGAQGARAGTQTHALTPALILERATEHAAPAALSATPASQPACRCCCRRCRCPQNPEAWLKKELSIKQLSLSLDQHSQRGGPRTPAPTPHDSAAALAQLPPRAGRPSVPSGGAAGGAHTYQPMLRVASVRASALLPAFAWLEVRGQSLAGGPAPRLMVHACAAPAPVVTLGVGSAG